MTINSPITTKSNGIVANPSFTVTNSSLTVNEKMIEGLNVDGFVENNQTVVIPESKIVEGKISTS